MSSYYGNYSQYLGAQRCCSLKTQGPQGPQGPTGPAAVGTIGYTGPTGPSPIINTVTSLTLTGSSILIPTQTQPIAYYTVDLTNSDQLDAVTNLGTFPTGFQAIIFITSNTLTVGQTATIGTLVGGGIGGITYQNLNTQQTLSGTPGNFKTAILTIYNDGSAIYGNLVTYY
jgi:hypothetical protein